MKSGLGAVWVDAARAAVESRRKATCPHCGHQLPHGCLNVDGRIVVWSTVASHQCRVAKRTFTPWDADTGPEWTAEDPGR